MNYLATNYPRSYQNEPAEVIEELPCFVDTSKLSWVSIIENNYHTIYDELKEFIEKKKNDDVFLARYPTITEGYWGRLDLKFWNMIHPNAENFAKTMEVMDKVPNYTRITLNLLKPQSRIKPHNGENDAYFRGHLALKIPGSLPNVGMRVGDQFRSWEEGKVILFSDAQNHEAFNLSDDTRIVMVFDVWRDEYMNVYKQSIIHNISTYTLILLYKKITSKLPEVEGFKYIGYINFHEVEKYYPKNLLSLYQRIKLFYESSYVDNKFTEEAQLMFWEIWEEAGGF